MIKKYFFTFLLIIVVFIIQQSLIIRLDARLIFWPTILSFITVIFNPRWSLIWGLSAGFLLDIFSLLPFGSHLIIFFLIIAVVHLLSKNFLTDRSILSFIILSLVAIVIYNCLLYAEQTILIKLISQYQIFKFNLKSLLIQSIVNLILTLILFFTTLKFSKKLETNILMR